MEMLCEYKDEGFMDESVNIKLIYNSHKFILLKITSFEHLLYYLNSSSSSSSSTTLSITSFPSILPSHYSLYLSHQDKDILIDNEYQWQTNVSPLVKQQTFVKFICREKITQLQGDTTSTSTSIPSLHSTTIAEIPIESSSVSLSLLNLDSVSSFLTCLQSAAIKNHRISLSISTSSISLMSPSNLINSRSRSTQSSFSLMRCDNCSISLPEPSLRYYRCVICSNLYLCHVCESNQTHSLSHPLYVLHQFQSVTSDMERRMKRIMRNSQVKGIRTTEKQGCNKAKNFEGRSDIFPTRSSLPTFQITNNHSPSRSPTFSTVNSSILPSSLLKRIYKMRQIVDVNSNERSIILPPLARIKKDFVIQNNGNHPWPSETYLDFYRGTLMMEKTHYTNSSILINNGLSVKEGEIITISIPIEAPRKEGRYISVWRLSNHRNTIENVHDSNQNITYNNDNSNSINNDTKIEPVNFSSNYQWFGDTLDFALIVANSSDLLNNSGPKILDLKTQPNLGSETSSYHRSILCNLGYNNEELNNYLLQQMSLNKVIEWLISHRFQVE